MIRLIRIDGNRQRDTLPAELQLSPVSSHRSIRIMAEYSEMNRRIYAGAARLGDEQRRDDVGLFWKSLHGTLCHLLWGDRQWMSRLDGWPPNTIPNPQSPT